MKNKGITLVALVITIIILLILAGITISQLTGSGLFENAKLAEEKSKEAQEKEDETLVDYENKIGEYVDGTRETTSKKQILWKSDETGTREVQLDVNVKDYDFLIVYYNTQNSSGDIVFDTSENAKFRTDYTYGNTYVFGDISLDIDNSIISMALEGNDDKWKNATYLLKIIGVKL